MLSNTALEAPRLAVEARTATRSATLPLLALLIGIAYPLTPALFYSIAANPSTPLEHVLTILAGTLLVFAIPAVGAMLLWSSTGANDVRALRARGVGMLLIVAPVLAVMLRTVASVFGVRVTGFPSIWTGFWVVATGVIIWRSTMPRPLLSSLVNRRTRRVHRTFVALLVLFAVAHLVVNLTALRDLPTYNMFAGWFRLVWRTPIGEPILTALLIIQLGSGLLLALDSSVGRSNFEHLCQITAGLFLAAFLTSHTLAVAVLGRALLNHGPAFTFASAGPMGLLGSAQGTALYPYYGLAVVALLTHLSRPLRLYVQRTMNAATARLAAGALIGTGVVVSALLLVALLNP